MRSLVPALHDMSELLKGRSSRRSSCTIAARKSLHCVGYQGLSMIAASWRSTWPRWDALAKAAGVPLCVLLGGTVGPVKAYNSNGLWLREPAQVAAEAVELREEGGFTRPQAAHRPRQAARRLRRRWTPCARRSASDMALMVDFNQGLDMSEALASLPRHRRSWPRLDRGADRLRQSRRLCAARGRAARHRSRSARTSTARATCTPRCRSKACDLVMPDFMRIGGVTGWLRVRPRSPAPPASRCSTAPLPEVAAARHAR